MTQPSDPGREQLVERIAAHLNATRLPARDDVPRETWPNGRHPEHVYDAWCATCRAGSDPAALRALIAAVLDAAAADRVRLDEPPAPRTPDELLGDVLDTQPGVAHGSGVSLDWSHAQAVIDALVELRALRAVPETPPAPAVAGLHARVADRLRRRAEAAAAGLTPERIAWLCDVPVELVRPGPTLPREEAMRAERERFNAVLRDQLRDADGRLPWHTTGERASGGTCPGCGHVHEYADLCNHEVERIRGKDIPPEERVGRLLKREPDTVRCCSCRDAAGFVLRPELARLEPVNEHVAPGTPRTPTQILADTIRAGTDDPEMLARLDQLAPQPAPLVHACDREQLRDADVGEPRTLGHNATTDPDAVTCGGCLDATPGDAPCDQP